MESIVKLEDVTKTYHQGQVVVNAVDHLSFEVTAGEFVALAGPSGSGKTTTLNLIGALDVPTSGAVKVEGTDIGKLSKRALARLRRDRVGFVFQAYNLIPVLTAYENAEFVLALQGVAKGERKGRVLEMLAAVGLDGMERRRPDEMSGGQQQRVAIARAMVAQPALVLADEPTANLDSNTAESLLSLMERLNEDRGTTFVFSTHDDRVLARAHRIIRMRDGRLEEDERRKAS
ncbi:MAG: ABC transporter ATP-binding protein [Myxococcales bacterium]|nr:ABC transporter ATP-binding protein [Myxococcales bacterium]